MKHLFLFVFVLMIFSCAPNGEQASDNTSEDQPASVETTTATDAMLAMKRQEGDLPGQTKTLSDALKENFDGGYDEKAVDVFTNVMVNFPSEEQIQSFVPVFLSMAKDKESIESFYTGTLTAFVTKYPQHEFSSTVGSVKTISETLENKAELINNPNFNRFSVEDAKDYIEMSEGYMIVSPRDPVAGAQIVKAGNQAKSIRGYAAKAVVLYDWLLRMQPDHPKAGQALFLKAFTYDNELNKKDQAKKLYAEFIKKYPDDDFADDAQLLLDNIGKTNQEFYESIVKKKGEKE